MVLPSVAEAFGLALTEAIYLGTPVIATRVGGIPEIVRDGVDGLLVPPASPEALADAVIRLIREPDLRESLAREGGDRIASQFTFGQMVRSYEGVYEELLRPRAERDGASEPSPRKVPSRSFPAA
jgi:glycosyltransferase involved in cell wall biosynthesis